MVKSRRSMPGWWWPVVTAYGVAMLLYLVLWWTTGDRLLPVYLVGYVAHLALPVAFITLPWAVARKRWPTVAVQLACAAGFVWLFGDVFLGSDPDPIPAGAPEVVVMSYNLGSGMAEPDRVVEVVGESGADIVGLVEVAPEVAAALEADLRATFPYQSVYGLGTPGKAVLSKYPILRSDLLWLHPGRPDLRAVLDIDGTEVTVLVAHPFPPSLAKTIVARRPDADAHVSSLLEVLEETQGPVMFLGDLNMTRMHEFYERLEEAGMRDAFRVAGSGPGFTEPLRIEPLVRSGLFFGEMRLVPLFRIDYVWASADWRVADAWVGEDAGSDHLPVLARLALVPEGE